MASPAIAKPLPAWRRGGSLGGVAFMVAGLCLLPLLAVVAAAFTGGTETVQKLADTVLWGYAGNTILLVLLVATGACAVGVGAAWLVTMTRFPGVRIFELRTAVSNNASKHSLKLSNLPTSVSI